MNNPGITNELWTTLRKKWSALVSEGRTLTVDFNFLNDPHDESKVLAIDVVQNIDGEGHVQTVQKRLKEAYPVIGIDLD